MSNNFDQLSTSMKDATASSSSKDIDLSAHLTRSQVNDPAASAATAKATAQKKTKVSKTAAKTVAMNPNPKEARAAGKEPSDPQTKKLSATIRAKNSPEVVDVDEIQEVGTKAAKRTKGPVGTVDQAQWAKDEIIASMLKSAMKAAKEGNQEKSDMYFEIYKLMRLNQTVTVPALVMRKESEKLNTSLPIKRTLVPDPFPTPEGRQNTLEGGTNFHWGNTNSHKDVGFTPYFEQNLLELKGPLPLTIFNKAWQDAALQYHTKKRPKNDDNSTERGMRYTGYPYPSEWLMSYSNWSLNYAEFLITMRNIYRYKTLGQWIVLHMANADKIIRKDRFMVALRYDIRIRAKAFAHQVVRDGVSSFLDISIFRQDVYNTAYGEARRFDKLLFRDSNPYAVGGARFNWDPHTGLNPGKRITGQQANPWSAQPAPAISHHQTSQVLTLTPTTSPPKPKESRSKGPGYQGKNFLPNYAETEGNQPTAKAIR
ncbi:hypothetical protein PTTG_08126 [Puccinia triticina 1-1 BBBD Race 1]|uniref:Uncharacterized protein n=1 Tax=Puccinia triticina (isolate 1-1 / race 1 (BBBD)) TaxID=630390 RepID=A0A180G713_PUCT1|nr:hypothetical protein PTTG_08126 [Puccinia triticina 1-1 BBBD Race 1]